MNVLKKIELKVSDKASVGCRYCHEDATFIGEVARFDQPFIDTLEAGMEITLTGKNIFENQYLEAFLKQCQSKGVICKIAIEQGSLAENGWVVDKWVQNSLVKGIAITFNGHSDELLEYLASEPLQCIKGKIVVQVMFGLQSYTSMKALFDQGLAIRILGNPDLGQGSLEGHKLNYKQEVFYQSLGHLSEGFTSVSYDALAERQLNSQQRYGGSEGIYIDLVRGEFAPCAESMVSYPLQPSIEEMFKTLESL